MVGKANVHPMLLGHTPYATINIFSDPLAGKKDEQIQKQGTDTENTETFMCS